MRHTIVHEVIALPTEISYNDGIKIIMQSQHMTGVLITTSHKLRYAATYIFAAKHNFFRSGYQILGTIIYQKNYEKKPDGSRNKNYRMQHCK